MNAKLPFSLILTALCAAAASAQVVGIHAPANPVMGLPKLLPSPLSGPLMGVGISLPAPMALPAVSLAAAPAAAIPAAALVATVPTPIVAAQRLAPMPAVSVVAARENRANPFRAVLPDGVARFDGAAPAKTGDDARSEEERLNRIFDGEDQPAERPTVEL
ncbi:MAG: hypothetical protein HY079_13845, partial [Elusimicrobia bacterium]|nr:hypothetical protein [Elusimicrobiota bacterium]